MGKAGPESDRLDGAPVDEPRHDLVCPRRGSRRNPYRPFFRPGFVERPEGPVLGLEQVPEEDTVVLKSDTVAPKMEEREILPGI